MLSPEHWRPVGTDSGLHPRSTRLCELEVLLQCVMSWSSLIQETHSSVLIHICQLGANTGASGNAGGEGCCVRALNYQTLLVYKRLLVIPFRYLTFGACDPIRKVRCRSLLRAPQQTLGHHPSILSLASMFIGAIDKWTKVPRRVSSRGLATDLTEQRGLKVLSAYRLPHNAA